MAIYYVNIVNSSNKNRSYFILIIKLIFKHLAYEDNNNKTKIIKIWLKNTKIRYPIDSINLIRTQLKYKLTFFKCILKKFI